MNRYSRPLPARISRLDDLAVDLWWSWHPARQVFRRLDYENWRATAHNPVRMLSVVSTARLEAAAADPAFLTQYDAAIQALDDARTAREGWWTRRYPGGTGQPVAYFSAEFALHQSLPIYAGGLGVLAGDHCKEAGDLGVPLIGIGFMYPQGYFHQRLSPDGWQEESYEQLNWLTRRSSRRFAPTGNRALLPCRSVIAPSSSMCGACAPAASASTCSIPGSKRMHRRIASFPPGCTA